MESSEDYKTNWDNFCRRVPTIDLEPVLETFGSYELYVFCGKELSDKYSEAIDAINSSKKTKSLSRILSHDLYTELSESPLKSILDKELESPQLKRITLVPAFIDQSDRLSQVIDTLSLLPKSDSDSDADLSVNNLCIFGKVDITSERLESLIAWWKTYFKERDIRKKSLIEDIFRIQFHINPAVLKELVRNLDNPLSLFDIPQIRTLIGIAYSSICLSNPLKWDVMDFNLCPDSRVTSLLPSLDSITRNDDRLKDILLDLVAGSDTLFCITEEEPRELTSAFYYPYYGKPFNSSLIEGIQNQKKLAHYKTVNEVNKSASVIDLRYKFNALSPILLEDVFNRIPLGFHLPFIKMFDRQTNSPIYKIFKPAVGLKGANYVPYISEDLIGEWRNLSVDWILKNDRPVPVKKGVFHLNMFLRLNGRKGVLKTGTIKETNSDGTFDIRYEYQNKIQIYTHVDAEFIHSREEMAVEFYKPSYDWAIVELASRTKTLRCAGIISAENNYEETLLFVKDKLSNLINLLYESVGQFTSIKELINPPYLSDFHTIYSSIEQSRNTVMINIKHKETTYDRLKDLTTKLSYYVKEDSSLIDKDSLVEYWTGSKWTNAKIIRLESANVEGENKRIIRGKTYEISYIIGQKAEHKTGVNRSDLRYANIFFMEWINTQRSNRRLKGDEYPLRIGIRYDKNGAIIIENVTSTWLLSDIIQFIYSILNNKDEALLANIAKDTKKIGNEVAKEITEDDEIQDVDDFEMMLEAEAEAQIIEEIKEVQPEEVQPEEEPLAGETKIDLLETRIGRTPFLSQRLRRIDPGLFEMDSSDEILTSALEGEFSGRIFLENKRQANDKSKYTYSRKCPYFRRPMVLTDEVADDIKSADSRSISLNPKESAKWCDAKNIGDEKRCEAIRYGSSEDNQHWYVCPRIFDAYEGRPLSVSDLSYEKPFKPKSYVEKTKSGVFGSPFWRIDENDNADILKHKPTYKGRIPAQSYQEVGNRGINTLYISGSNATERDYLLPNFQETEIENKYTICCFKEQNMKQMTQIMKGNTNLDRRGVGSKVKKDWGSALLPDRLGLLSKELLAYLTTQTIVTQYDKYQKDSGLATTANDLPFYRMGVIQNDSTIINGVSQAYKLSNANKSVIDRIITNMDIYDFIGLNDGNIRVEFDNPFTKVTAYQAYREFLLSDETKPIKYVYDLMTRPKLYVESSQKGTLIIIFEIIYRKQAEEISIYIPGYCDGRLQQLIMNIEETDIVFLLRHHGNVDLLVQLTPANDYKRVFTYKELPISTKYIIQTLAKGRLSLLKDYSPLLLLSNILPSVSTLYKDELEKQQRLFEECKNIDTKKLNDDKCKPILDIANINKHLPKPNRISYYVKNQGEYIIGAVLKSGHYIPLSSYLRPYAYQRTINIDGNKTEIDIKLLTRIVNKLKIGYKETQEFLKTSIPQLYAEPIYIFGTEETASAIINSKGYLVVFAGTPIEEVGRTLGHVYMNIAEINKALYKRPKDATVLNRKSHEEVINILGEYKLEWDFIVHKEVCNGIVVKFKDRQIVVPIQPIRKADNIVGVSQESIIIKNPLKYINKAKEFNSSTNGQLPCLVIRGFMDTDKPEYTHLLIDGDYTVQLAKPIPLNSNQQLAKTIIDMFISADILEPSIITAKKVGDLNYHHKFYLVKDFLFKQLADLLSRYELRPFKSRLVELLDTFQANDNTTMDKILSLLTILTELIIVEDNTITSEFDDLDVPLEKCTGIRFLRNSLCRCNKKVNDLKGFELLYKSGIFSKTNTAKEALKKYFTTNSCALRVPMKIDELIKSIVNDIRYNKFRRYQLLNNVFRDVNIGALYHTENPLEEILTENSVDPRYRHVEDVYENIKRDFYRGIVPYGETEPEFYKKMRI